MTNAQILPALIYSFLSLNSIVIYHKHISVFHHQAQVAVVVLRRFVRGLLAS
jgi:hypothetical protein